MTDDDTGSSSTITYTYTILSTYTTATDVYDGASDSNETYGIQLTTAGESYNLDGDGLPPSDANVLANDSAVFVRTYVHHEYWHTHYTQYDSETGDVVGQWDDPQYDRDGGSYSQNLDDVPVDLTAAPGSAPANAKADPAWNVGPNGSVTYVAAPDSNGNIRDDSFTYTAYASANYNGDSYTADAAPNVTLKRPPDLDVAVNGSIITENKEDNPGAFLDKDAVATLYAESNYTGSDDVAQNYRLVFNAGGANDVQVFTDQQCTQSYASGVTFDQAFEADSTSWVFYATSVNGQPRNGVVVNFQRLQDGQWTTVDSVTINFIQPLSASLDVTNMDALTIDATQINSLIAQVDPGLIPAGFDWASASQNILSTSVRGGDVGKPSGSYVYTPHHTYGTDDPWDPDHPFGYGNSNPLDPNQPSQQKGGASFIISFTDDAGQMVEFRVRLKDQHVGYDYYHIGNVPDKNTQGQNHGGLMLSGGGDGPETIPAYQWFLQQTAGGDVVVIGNDKDDDAGISQATELFEDYGVSINSVTVFDFNVYDNQPTTDAMSAAGDDGSDDSTGPGREFLDRLRGAEALFFMGGDQWPYVKMFQGTEAAQQIQADNNAGSMVVGGTSAGLAILGNYVFTAQKLQGSYDTLQGADVLHQYLNPGFYDGSSFTIATNLLALDPLRNVLTETHFSDPNNDVRTYEPGDGNTYTSDFRLGRSLAFIGALMDPWYGFGISSPKGLGIDNNTVLVVDQSQHATVYGSKNVYFIWTDPGTQPTVDNNQTFEDLQIDLAGVNVRWFASGDTFDLSWGWDSNYNGGNKMKVSITDGDVTIDAGGLPAGFGN